MRVVFNDAPLRWGPSLPPPSERDLPERGYRGSSLEFVCADVTDYVRGVLDAAPLVGDRRFVLVDVLVTRVQPGRAPGLGVWHIDTVPEPWHDSAPERHHLFVTGVASLPEFLAEPVALEVPESCGPYTRMREIDRQIRALSPPTVSVTSCRFTTYGRADLHRATPGRGEERRLLVRVTETDVVAPMDRTVAVDMGVGALH